MKTQGNESQKRTYVSPCSRVIELKEMNFIMNNSTTIGGTHPGYDEDDDPFGQDNMGSKQGLFEGDFVNEWNKGIHTKKNSYIWSFPDHLK